MFIFYLAGYFYFKNIDKKHFRIEKEIELLVKIKKVEPYYSGYLNTGFSSSVGNFIFKTDKKYFSPGETC
ncbi:MAG: hypothetical protein J7K20_04570, partial [Thermodesulfobacterium sp.]|nr:hypothetical protein [Thermodesulfobacterium sp.]